MGLPSPGGAPHPASIPPPGHAPPPPPPRGAPSRRDAPPHYQEASSHHSPPANDGSDSANDDSDNPRPPVRRCLYGGPGSTSQTGGIATTLVLEELLDNEIWLRVWVLVWEMEVVVRKVMREVPRETMLPGMWVLRGGGGTSSSVVTGAVGETRAHPAGRRKSGAGVSSRTRRTPVQPTWGRGWSGWSGARRRSAGPGESGWSGGGGRMPTRCEGSGGMARASAGGSATT